MPVVALGLGTVVLGEPLTARGLVGLALIGAGLAVMDGRLVTTLRARATGAASSPSLPSG
jgi:drug/metabolite transporter (DMT)-like permease